LARAHRRIAFIGDLDRPLLCSDVFQRRTLAASTIGLARSINPFIHVDKIDSVPDARLLSLGVGHGSVAADLGLGADGWCAVLGEGASIAPGARSIWGALFASCLGAATAFHAQRGVVGYPQGRYSLWDLGTSSPGPQFSGPVDVGHVLQVGVGAVGAALDYFLALVGLSGTWRLVDGDVVDVSNLNRQLLFVARDAGFPDGEQVFKALRGAELLGPIASGGSKFYDDDPIARSGEFDVLLPLANEHNVRRELQRRQPTVLVHATTGPAWEAFLHRHIAGRDDCIDCRLPDETTPRFSCGEGEIRVGPLRMDAALPFLSATAGLALAAALVRLQLGVLGADAINLWSINLEEPEPLVRGRTHDCRVACTLRLPYDARSRIDAHSRFARLDGEAGALR
jgi:hypothetical protein